MNIPTPPPKPHEINDLAGNLSQAAILKLLVLAALRPSPTNRDKYLHLDGLRYRQAPNGLSPEDHWLAVRFARRASSRALPFADVKGAPFTLSHLPALSELLHEVDRDAAGVIDASPGVANAESRDRYLMTSLFEEAITSSQLEGASTTRERAKDLLRQGRAPKDHSERMIVNTYRAMEWLRTQGESELTPGIVLKLHELVTEGTLEDPAHAVAYDTARRDLLELVKEGLLMMHKEGKKFVFTPAGELGRRVRG